MSYTASWTNPDTEQDYSYSGGGGMSNWGKAGLLGLGGLGLGALFGGSEGSAAPEAGGYLSQIQQMLPQYFKPYQQMLDPTALMSKIGAGYQQSPGYQFQLGQAMKGIGQAAAAGGMAGSPMQQQQAAQTATGLANQDYYNYLNQALGLYQTGAGGYRGLGEDLSSILMSQAQLAQLQQEEAAKEAEQKHHDLWSAIGSGIGAIAGL